MKKIYSFLFFLSSLLIAAQNQNNIWLFGDQQGLNFNSGSPVVTYSSGMSGFDATEVSRTSICDNSGNLLFYTNGKKVWDKTNNVMSNGTGLHGSATNGTGAIICPKPGSSSEYFVFTTSSINGMEYSVVDMSLNGGLGDITIKNTQLMVACAEQMIGVIHNNGSDYWIVAHGWNDNKFYAYQVTSFGLAPAIITSIGNVFGGGAVSSGQIKFAPNGNQFAVVYDFNVSGVKPCISIFDFDRTSGIVSNEQTLNMPQPTWTYIYGLEYSSDGSKLYITDGYYQIGQFALCAGDSTAIKNSLQIIATSSTYLFGTLQRGPDGKIYAGKVEHGGGESRYLGVINNPNNIGLASNFVDNAINLSPNENPYASLPGFVLFNPVVSGNPTPFSLPPLTATNVKCYNDSSGTVSANPSPAGVYAYSWSNGATTQSISNLGPGKYIVTVSNGGACLTHTDSVTITQPPQPPDVGLVRGFVKCYGDSSGSISVPVINFLPQPLTYQWNTGSTNLALTNVPSAVYSVVITDANGCTLLISDSVPQPQNPLSVVPAIITPKCNGNSNGSITTSVAGGWGSYSYSWSNGVTNASAISNIISDTYTLTVTDAQQCKSTQTISVTQPVVLSVVRDTVMINKCFGDSTAKIKLHAIGGTAAYGYLWNNGVTADSIYAVAAGIYVVEIKDANDCEVKDSIVIVPPTPVTISTDSVLNVLCYGGSTGLIQVSLAGGTPGYSYSWITPSGTTSAQNISNLMHGNYTVVVADMNGCTRTAVYTITQPASGLSIKDTVINVSCFGKADGDIKLVASPGGTPGYLYTWFDANGTVSNASALMNATAGTYTLQVVDQNACSTSKTITISQPLPLTGGILTSSTISVKCRGDATGFAVAATPSGGTAAYSYSWLPGGSFNDTIKNVLAGSYTLTTTDKNGCSVKDSITIYEPDSVLKISVTASNAPCFNKTGSAVANASGGTISSSGFNFHWVDTAGTPFSLLSASGPVNAGSYWVFVTDDNACSDSALVVITEPTDLIILEDTVKHVDVKCTGAATGIAAVNVSGGTPSYFYSWDNGSTLFQANGLTAGPHKVLVNFGPGKQCSDSLIVFIEQPDSVLKLQVLLHTNVTCYGNSTGAASVIASGGVSAYTYVWSSNAGTSNAVSNLSYGTYTVTVTDQVGCSTDTTIKITQPNTPLHAGFATDVSFGGVPLTVNFTNTSTGATAYSWNFGDTTSSVETNPAHIYPHVNSYTVVLYATNGSCVDSAFFEVVSHEAVEIIVPNVFTPNADVVNDFFMVKNSGLKTLEVLIYDRWGLLMKTINGLTDFWDGKTSSGSIATEGTYYYLLKATDLDGKEHKSSGYLQLIR